ncbi:organic cation transporter protein-like [Amphiura filiformis]|uniref:organic cation transporter protein-like n=1 Tax=Amphiura filiformis TaxID=82378 RepID=UPI003B21B5B8
MKFDDIIIELGEFGRYQRRAYFLIGLVGIATAAHMLAQVFLAGESDHWCVVPELKQENCNKWPELSPDACNAAKKDASIPLQTDDDMEYTYDNCLRYNMTGIHFYPGIDTTDHTNDTLECDEGWLYDTSQYSNTVVIEYDLVCKTSGIVNLAQSIYFVGVLVGSIGFGMLGDWIGRYYAYFIATGLFLVAGIATAFAPNFTVFIVLRFFVGAAALGTFISAFTLGTEFVGPSKRTITGIGMQLFFTAGFLVLALLAFLIRDWFVLQLVISVPIVLIFPLAFIIVESPRWLISRGRFDDAEKIIKDVARVNQRKVPEPLFEEHEKQMVSNEQHQSSVIDLFRTPNMRVRTINITFIWFVQSLVYYGLSLSTSDLGIDDYLAFFISGIVEVPAIVYCMFGIEWFGRKPNFVALMLIGGIACLCTAAIPKGIWLTVVAMIGKFCIAGTFSIIYVYTVELCPTPVRNAGLGLSSMSSRVGGILAPLILLLGDYWEPLPYVVFGTLAVAAGLTALLLPETKGRPLPETLEDGEYFGKDPPLIHEGTSKGHGNAGFADDKL